MHKVIPLPVKFFHDIKGIYSESDFVNRFIPSESIMLLKLRRLLDKYGREKSIKERLQVGRETRN